MRPGSRPSPGQVVTPAGAPPPAAGGAGDKPALQAALLARDWSGVLAQLARTPPQSAEAYAARALATAALQPGAEGARRALPDWRRALELKPGNSALASNLLQGLMDAGDVAEAIRLSSAWLHDHPQLSDLRDKQLRALCLAARWDEALSACDAACACVAPGARVEPATWSGLHRELRSQWWKPLNLGGVQLRAAQPSDRTFITRCFRDADFMARFHRFQAADDESVTAFITRSSLPPSRARRLDWLVCQGERRLGLAALVDLDLQHRRGELLVGLPEAEASPGVALKAALAAMDFAFSGLRLHKLVSYVYGDNADAQANTLHLGLRQEGRMRQHLQGPAGPVDLFVNGLLAPEFHADARLQRLLCRWRADSPAPGTSRR